MPIIESSYSPRRCELCTDMEYFHNRVSPALGRAIRGESDHITAAHTTVASGLPRALDIAVALAVLTVSAPVILLCAASVWLSSTGPIFFRQIRVGRRGLRFELIKFRTMRTDDSGPRVTAEGDLRITPVGRWLRRSKLDELPELWNVVRGDMALVGPRPEVPSLVDVTNPMWNIVLLARPGLTDPVTLRLRNEEQLLASTVNPQVFYVEVLQPWKLRGYCDYLRRRSILVDVKVLGSTFVAVLFPHLAETPALSDLTALLKTVDGLDDRPRAHPEVEGR